MPLSPSQDDKRRPSGHAWHQDDTVDAHQILQASLEAWDVMEDEQRTEARRVFYAALFKCCGDYLVHRMVGEDKPTKSAAAQDQRQSSMVAAIEKGILNLGNKYR